MPTKSLASLMFLCLLLSLSLCNQVSQTNAAVLDELPGLGETLIVDKDSTFTVNEGETVVCAGELSIQADGTSPTVKIINYGNLKFTNSINFNSAKFTITNYGTLVFQDASFDLTGFANVTIKNEELLTLEEINIQVYAGYMYIINNGTLNSHNLYVKDQNDGTWISNYKDASFTESTFVANGAVGKIEIFSNGNLQIHHGTFDGNYGGTLNLNTALGNLIVTESNFDVSGASHGKTTELNIIGGTATWENCIFNNNAAKINYLNTQELTLNNCSIQNTGTDASTILSNSGPLVFEKGSIAGSGVMSITNWMPSELKDCTFSSSGSLTLINNNQLTTENWLVKTTQSTANINFLNTENSKFIFNKSFIETVSVETLSAIGPEGQQFTETSGGTITVTNQGTIQLQSNPQTTTVPTQTPEPTQTVQNNPEASQTPHNLPADIKGSSDPNLTYAIVIVSAIIVIAIIVFVAMKRRQCESKQQ